MPFWTLGKYDPKWPRHDADTIHPHKPFLLRETFRHKRTLQTSVTIFREKYGLKISIKKVILQELGARSYKNGFSLSVVKGQICMYTYENDLK